MSAAAGPGAGGYVDLWGPTGDPGRSIVAGWLGQPWKEAVTRGKLRVEADTAAGTVRCNATAMVFAREDVAAIGVGVILLCDTPVSALAAARFFDISTGDQTCRLRLAPGARYVDAPALSEAVRPLVARAHPLDHRNIAIASLDLRETGYTATADFTLAVELVLACDEAGLLALATVAASDVAVEHAAVLAGRSRQQVDPALIIAGPPRPDRGGARISLAMRLHEAPPAGSERWLEITLADGRTARAALPPAITPSRDALLKALAAIDPDADIDRLFDNVMGPAIGALQAARTRLPVSVTEAKFGTPPRKPRATLIIPLYARVDLMEVQLALFCGQPCMDDTEILFVVDDPPLQPDARALAASAYPW
jgi:hypothetical protein